MRAFCLASAVVGLAATAAAYAYPAPEADLWDMGSGSELWARDLPVQALYARSADPYDFDDEIFELSRRDIDALARLQARGFKDKLKGLLKKGKKDKTTTHSGGQESTTGGNSGYKWSTSGGGSQQHSGGGIQQTKTWDVSHEPRN